MRRNFVVAAIVTVLALATGCDSRRSAMEEMKSRAIRRPKGDEAASSIVQEPKPAAAKAAVSAKNGPRPKPPVAGQLEAGQQNAAEPGLPGPAKPRKSRREIEEEKEAEEGRRLVAERLARRKAVRDRDEQPNAAAHRLAAASKFNSVPQPPAVEPAQSAEQRAEQAAKKSTALEAINAMRRKFAEATSRQQRHEIWTQLAATQRLVLDKAISPTVPRAAGKALSSVHENQLVELAADFQFDPRNRRDVAMLVSNDMATIVTAQSADGSKSGNFGRISAWDVFAGSKTHSWPIVDRRREVGRLSFTADERHFITEPDIGFYHLASGGASLPLGRGFVATAPATMEAQQPFLAAGIAGAPQTQSRVLHLLRCGTGIEQTGGWDAFEAMVTAAAFANHSPRIAFAVRERNNHRLFIGGVPNLTADDLWQIEESVHSRSWSGEDGRDRAMVPGITAMAFSHDDRLLVTYGRYGEREYRATIWELDWSRRTAKALRAPVQSQTPILWEGNQNVIHFIGDTSLAALETQAGVTVIDVQNGGLRVRAVDLVKSRFGRPLTAFSDDNRWLAVGDDQGRVRLLNLETGEVLSLTPSGRPAQSGAIVGLAFANKNPITQSTEYLVTAGEENTIKLWNLAERIGSAAPSRESRLSRSK